MAKAADLIGKQFGKLKVLARGENRGVRLRWICQCECGGTTLTATTDLVSGKSTGCRRCGVKKHGATKRGGWRTITYSSWDSMRSRCNNPRDPGYARYGGRGIRVCERWDSFSTFLSDMGERPSKAYSIDRIDNDGNYTPENCRWATSAEQSRNRTWNPSSAWSGSRNDAGQFIGHLSDS